MSYTYHGASNLIPLPGRSVQTYPSGLVRVERSFVCRKADVAKNRNTIRVNERMPMDDGAPAFDGLFIFPEPQEQVRDDGFVEFRVTAYGRTNINGVIETSFEQGSFQTDGNSDTIDDGFSGHAKAWIPQYTQKIISKADSFIESLPLLEQTPIAVKMSAIESATTSESGAVFVPYNIWENWVKTGPSAPLVYKNFQLTETIGSFQPVGLAGVNYIKIGGRPYDHVFRFQSRQHKIEASTNFGIFSEYVISYRFYYLVRFSKNR
jgi:hypothetical protein